jgi:hypothetical protein
VDPPNVEAAPVEVPVDFLPPPVANYIPVPSIPEGLDTRTEMDKALDAVQPNRPGIKISKVAKDGRRLAEPKKEIAAESKAP